MIDRVPVRTDLADLEPYGASPFDVPVRLSSNEAAEPPPAAYLGEVRRRLADLRLNRYPYGILRDLRERLAEAFGLTWTRVWAANGSYEILQQLLLAYGGAGRRLLAFHPGPSMSPVLAQITATPLVQHPLPEGFALLPDEAGAAAAEHDPDIVMLVHPNNPTGMPVGLDVVEALHAASRALVVVDEAYVDFGAESAVRLLDSLPRVVVVRTFSKAYRLAGLRLGYLLAHDWVVDDIRRVRLPYHLDAMKQIAAMVALEMRDHFLEYCAGVALEREKVAAKLAGIPGVEVFPSITNFLLFRTGIPDLFDRLLARGVLVRDFSTTPGLAGCLRVTIGAPHENDRFLAALTEIVGQVS